MCSHASGETQASPAICCWPLIHQSAQARIPCLSPLACRQPAPATGALHGHMCGKSKWGLRIGKGGEIVNASCDGGCRYRCHTFARRLPDAKPTGDFAEDPGLTQRSRGFGVKPRSCPLRESPKQRTLEKPLSAGNGSHKYPAWDGHGQPQTRPSVCAVRIAPQGQFRPFPGAKPCQTRDFALFIPRVPRYSPPVAPCTLGGWRTYMENTYGTPDR